MRKKRNVMIAVFIFMFCLSLGAAYAISETNNYYNKPFAVSVYGTNAKVYAYGSAPTASTPYVYGMFTNTSSSTWYFVFSAVEESYVGTTGRITSTRTIYSNQYNVASGSYMKTGNTTRLFNSSTDNLYVGYRFTGTVKNKNTKATVETIVNRITQTP